MMVQHGAKVALHYILHVEGKQIDSSQESEPLIYTHGARQMIPGFEKNLEGMEPGEKKNFLVEPEYGYGLRDEEMIRKLPREEFQDESMLKEGEILSGSVGQQPFQATIVKIQDDEVTLDFNHPLAGKILEFEVEILSVKNEE